MPLTSSTIVAVADETPESVATTVIIQPPSSDPTTARGRLVHPDLGTYDYYSAPDETVNVDGGPLYRPIWSRAQTLGGSADALWSGFLADARVVERWANGEVGAPIAHLRMLWQFFTNPPTPDEFIIWTPTYADTSQGYKVAIVDVRAGGGEYTIDRRLLAYGYAPQPVEIEMRVIGLED